MTSHDNNAWARRAREFLDLQKLVTLTPEDIARAEEALSRPPIEITDDVLEQMAIREVEIGCEIDRMTHPTTTPKAGE